MMVLNQLPVMFRNGSVESAADRLLDDAVQALNEWSESWDPACNVFEDGEGFTVQMAIPGLETDAINVQVEKNILRVKGGRSNDDQSDKRTWYARGIKTGPFSCSFRLPDYADQDKAVASCKHGLLTIRFPKREEAKPRQITIQTQ
ncbi:MAG TPA: Hsp20/alpha crystallin family protein [Nitrospiraceae bacterium]|nr:Hsp20/alpha crystallin family protein [Nitrospiraceae bacterium]